MLTRGIFLVLYLNLDFLVFIFAILSCTLHDIILEFKSYVNKNIHFMVLLC
jgi:hypothetical protein